MQRCIRTAVAGGAVFRSNTTAVPCARAMCDVGTGDGTARPQQWVDRDRYTSGGRSTSEGTNPTRPRNHLTPATPTTFCVHERRQYHAMRTTSRPHCTRILANSIQNAKPNVCTKSMPTQWCCAAVLLCPCAYLVQRSSFSSCAIVASSIIHAS